MSLRTLLVATLLCSACLAQTDPCQKGDLFQTGKVWTVHLAFSRDQWRALEPAHRPGRGAPNFGRGEWLQGAEGKRNGFAATMGIEFNTVHADFMFNGQAFHDVAVRYKGNGTYVEGM